MSEDFNTGFGEMDDDPPEDIAETIKAAREHFGHAGNGKAHATKDDAAPGFGEIKDDLGEWDAGDDTEKPSPRGFLLGNVFARGFLSCLFADGGTGKTAVRVAQYLSLATGRPLTGEHVFQRCRVLVVSFEDGAQELRRRILAARLHHEIELPELKGWLFLAALRKKDGKLMLLNEKGQAIRGVLADKIEAAIARRRIDVIGLDPYVKAHSLGENSNNDMDELAQLLTDLSEKYNIAVDVVHHTRKGASDPGNADSGRGAGATKDAGRLVYTATRMSPAEAEAFAIPEDQRRFFIRMDDAKVNIVPATKTKWFRLISVPLDNSTELYPHGDHVQTVEPWAPPEAWEGLSTELQNRILDAIDAGLPDGNRYSDARSATDRAAWKVILEHSPEKTETQAREIIRTWVRNGVLKAVDCENPATRKTVRGLRINPGKRPT